MPHVEVLVAHAAPQTTLPRRVLASTGADGYLVHPVEGVFKRDRVRGELDIRLVLVFVVNEAQLAKVLNLTLAPDILQVPAASKNLTTWSVAATSHSRLLLVLLDGNLLVRRMSAEGAPGGDSAESLGVKEDPPLDHSLGDEDWWGCAALIARAKPFAVFKLFVRQRRTTGGILHTSTV